MKNQLKPITEKQSVLMVFILKFIKKYGYAPSYNEMIKSSATDNNGSGASIISALISKGYIKKEKNIHRGIQLTSESSIMNTRQIKAKVLKN